VHELLFGTWSPQIIACSQQYPWRVFAAVLVAILLLDLMFLKGRLSGLGDGGDFGGSGGSDCGDGDGGGCGD
jgi:hypothetical protein